MRSKHRKIWLIALLALASCVMAAIPVGAQPGGSWTTYVTAPGDRLALIARQFCTSWEELYALNRSTIGESPDALAEGLALVLLDRCPPAARSGAIWDRGPLLGANGATVGNVYEAAWGDRLSAVAGRFGLGFDQILRANRLTNHKLSAGQRLIIPGLRSLQTGPRPAPPLAPLPGPGAPRSQLEIVSPAPGARLSGAVVVAGTGANLPGGKVSVQVLDAAGNVIGQGDGILLGHNVQMGGRGVWSVELVGVAGPPQAGGAIEAFSSGDEARAAIPVRFP